jgi:acyl-CoA thioester hydrolase
MIAAAVAIKVQFYDLDPCRSSGMETMHGPGQARCALLDTIGYNYVEMKESGYLWRCRTPPQVRARHPFGQDIKVEARLAEYENRLRFT